MEPTTPSCLGVGRRAQTLQPRRFVLDGLLSQSHRPSFHQVLKLDEHLGHLRTHRAVSDRNQADDQLRGRATLPAPWLGCLLDPADEHGADVLGVVERPAGDYGGQKLLDVVMVRLGATQLGGQRPERLRGQHLLDLSIGQSALLDRLDPAVALRDRTDGLVLRGELGDGRPALLLRLDHLVGRQLSAEVLEHALQNGVGVDLVRFGRGVALVGLVEGDVGDVGVSASGHGDVEVLAGGRAGHHDV